MRKNLFPILLAVSILTAGLASCSKNEVQSEPKVIKMTINTGATDVVAVRSGITPVSGGFQCLWNKNDVLGVWVDAVSGTPSSFTNVAETAATGSFEGTVEVTDGQHTVYAYSPSSALSGIVSGSSVALAIPAKQTATSSTFDPAADILVAKPQAVEISEGTGTVNDMKFARLGSVLQIIPADQTTGSVLSADKVAVVKIDVEGASLAGKLTVDLSNAEVSAVSDASSSVELSFTDGEFTGIDGVKSAFAIVNPVTITSGMKVSFEITTDKHIITKEISDKDLVFPAGKLAVLNLGIADSNVQTTGESHEIGYEFYKEDFNWIKDVWNDSYPKYGMPGVKSNATGDKWNEYVVTGYAKTQDKFDEKGIGYNATTYVHYEGYIKLSSSAKAGYVKTPAIGGVDTGKKCSVSVSWDAATYLNPNGSATNESAYQTVTVSGSGKIVSCGTADAVIAQDGLSATIPVTKDEDHLFFMYTKQIIVEDADETTQIQFGEDGTSGDFRSYVDNISVKKVAAGTNAAEDVLVAKPQTVDCEATEQETIGGAGGDVTLTLRMDRAWTLLSNDCWITIKSIKAGTTATAINIEEDKMCATETGTGLLYLNAIVTVALNETGAQRSGTLSFINSATSDVCKTITITQEARQGTTTCVAKWTMTSVFNKAVYEHDDGNSYTSYAYEAIGKPWAVDKTDVPSDVVEGGFISVVNGSGASLKRSTGANSHWWNRLRLEGVANGDGWCFKATGINAAQGDKIELKYVHLGCANAGNIPNTWELQYSYDGSEWIKLSDVTKPSSSTTFIPLDSSVEINKSMSNAEFYFRVIATTDERTGTGTSIPFILVHPDTATGTYATRTKLYTEDSDYITINVVNYE